MHAGDIPSAKPATRRPGESRKTVIASSKITDVRMLQEFYERGKLDGKPCRATYVLSGLIEEKNSAGKVGPVDRGDLPTSDSSPVPKESIAGEEHVKTILLVDEDDLDGKTGLERRLTF
jgi:hypothetical protein